MIEKDENGTHYLIGIRLEGSCDKVFHEVPHEVYRYIQQLEYAVMGSVVNRIALKNKYPDKFKNIGDVS